MKNMIMILSVLVFVIGFSGCAKSVLVKPYAPIVTKTEGSPIINIKVEKGAFKTKDGISNHWINIKYEIFKMASEQTKAAGKNYFVVVNKGVNNLNGSPITNIKELTQYCSGSFYKSTSYLKCDIGNGLNIIPIDDNLATSIFAWNADETLKSIQVP